MACDEAREAVRQRDEVLSIVLHDLGSPLGVVALAARVILHHVTYERIRTAANTVERAAHRMRRLVDDLRVPERAQGSKLTLEVREASPGAIVAELIDAFDAGPSLPGGTATRLGRSLRR